MNVEQLIKRLQKLNPEKEITYLAPNGLLLEPFIKSKQVNENDLFNYADDNIESYVIAWK